MPAPIRVLILEDSADDAELMLLHLRREGFDASWERVEDAPGLRAALAAGPWGLVLADYTLPGFAATAALAIVREADPDLPFLIVSGTVGEDVAVEVMRAGANDYVLKQNLTRLGPAVAREVRESENRRARRFAEREAEKLAAIVRSTDDAVIGLDLAGTIRSWNPGAEHLYGWAAEEAIGRPIEVLLPPDRRGEVAGTLARIGAGELVEHVERVRQRRDGTLVDVSLTISPIRDHAGRVIGASKIARDITAQRRAHEALARDALILANVKDAVVTTDLDGVVTSWNEGATRLFGYTADEMLGRHVSTYVPESARAARAELVRRIAAGRAEWNGEFEDYRRDGGRVWIDARVRYLRDASGLPIGLVGVSHDISTRKRDEETLRRQNDGLRLLTEAAGQLLAATDPVRMVEDLFATVCAHVGSDVFFNFRFNGRDLELESAGGIDGDARRAFARIDLGQHVCGASAQTRQVICVPNLCASDDPRAAGVKALGVRVYACFPLLAGDRLLGTLSFGSRTRDALDEQELEFLQAVCHYVATAKERLRAEAELRRTTVLLHAVADGTPDAVFVKDAAGRYLFCNPATAGYVGRSAEQVLGQDDLALFDPDSARRVMEVDRRVMATGAAETVEETLTAAGVTRTYLATKGPYRDGDGRTVGVLGISRDVTDRIRAQQQLRVSETRLRTVVETARVLVWEADPDTLDFTYVSDFCGDLLGLPAADWLRPGFWQAHLHPDDAAAAVRTCTAAIAEGQDHRLEYRMVRADGGVVWVDDVVRVVSEGGKVTAIQGAMIDITPRKLAEEALRESERKYRTLFENMAEEVHYWRVERDGGGRIATWRLVDANPPALKTWGKSLADIRGRTTDEIFGPGSTDHYRAVVERVTAEGVPHSYEDYFPALDRHFQFTTVPVGDHFITTGADVTAARRAAEAVRASERRLRSALQAAAIAFDWDVRADAAVRYFSREPAMPANVGRPDPVAEVAARIHPDDRARFGAVVADCLARGTEYQGTFRVVRPDGTIRWLDEYGTLERGADGTALRLSGFSLDVTDRVEAEDALRESEARFRAFMDNGPFLAWITDADGHLRYASGPFARALSVPAGGGEGLHPTDVFPADVARTYLDNNREVLRTGRVMATTEPGVLADGSPGQFLVYKFPIPSPDRALVGGVAIDVTERARLQADLLMRDRAIQAVHQGVVITDPTLPDNPIVYVSPGFERLTGYTATEVVGKNCRFLRGEGTDPAEFTRLSRAVRDEREYDGELLNYRKDGTTFWNELRITPVRDSNGRLVNFVGIQTDVTARRSLEDQLRQAQKMEAVGQLAGGVAHDFNNLLTVINGYSEMALGGTQPGHPLRDPLAAIRDAGERAANLTQQLLAFSRRAIVAPRVLDLNDVVASITKMLRRLIGEDIAFATVLCPTPCRVRIDPGQIEQVIMNLAVNARDAMPKGGRLTIETNREEVVRATPDCPPGCYVRLAVTDTGTGMTEDVKARIFEPFFTTKGVGKGTGLGLAMVYGIVRQAGGCVRVESAVGRGTTFSLSLPEVPVAEEYRPADGIVSIAPRGTETILLAEDEDAVRTISRLALEMQGYTVVEAESGAEAIATAAVYPGPVHLLVTDVVMPEMGGRDLADVIRATRPAVRVLYVSGYTNDTLGPHRVEEEVDAFLQKPFTPLTLARKVREVLDAPRPG